MTTAPSRLEAEAAIRAAAREAAQNHGRESARLMCLAVADELAWVRGKR